MTYHGGIITIEFVAYTEHAQRYIQAIESFNPPINKDTMDTAIDQVESEKQMALGYSNLDEVLKGLRELGELPWLKFDKLDVIDTSAFRRQTAPVYLSTNKLVSTKKVIIEFSLTIDDSTRNLLPLANRVFSLVGTNLQFFLTRELGIYFDNESIHYNKKQLTYRLVFKTYPDFSVESHELSDSITYVTATLNQADAFKRLCGELASIPRNGEYWASPPIEWIYKSTMQIVGTEGWQRIATEANCIQILHKMQVETKIAPSVINL